MRALILMFFLLAAAGRAQSWQLVWSDEFAGDRLDSKKWEVMLGDGTAYGLPSGWGNNEKQYYRRENIEVKDGLLVITAKKESYGGKSYTSGRVRTKGKGDWLYCRIEMRAKMPLGRGLWPAFWMLPTNSPYGGWAASGEIDIMEYIGHEPNVVHGTLHYGGQWPNNVHKGSSYTLPQGSFAEDFHVFAFEWEKTRMRWYVDGKLYRSTGEWYSTAAPYPAPFDVPFHLLINLAVGGNWPGSPDATTVFPQQLLIDYVRVYQKETAVAAESTAPSAFALRASPNPFNGRARIEFDLPRQTQVRLMIFDLQGRCVAVLFDESRPSGTHVVPWEAADAATGLYFVSLQTEDEQVVRPIVLLR